MSYSPQVFQVFEVPDKNGNISKFTLQEFPKGNFEETVESFLEFVKDEALSKSLGVIEDLNEVDATRKVYGEILEKGLSIACYEILPNGNTRLAGYNLLDSYTKSDEDIHHNYIAPKTQCIFDFCHSLYKEANIFEKFQVEKVLTAEALFVKSRYRGLGLAKKILEAETHISQIHDIKVSVSVFTYVVSQKVATSLGFVEVFITRRTGLQSNG